MANHPQECETCVGADFVEHEGGTLLPCSDMSWCEDEHKVVAGSYFCDLKKGHEGKHKTGAVEW